MSKVTVICIDAASRVFKRHGACAIGRVIFRKKLTRVQRLAFMSQHPACLVAMVAGATAHCWGCEIKKFGHTVRLIAPNYVKPFVKRQKNDVADAEAIVAPKGVIHVKRLAAAVADEAIDLSEGVRELDRVYLEQIEGLNVQTT